MAQQTLEEALAALESAETTLSNCAGAARRVGLHAVRVGQPSIAALAEYVNREPGAELGAALANAVRRGESTQPQLAGLTESNVRTLQDVFSVEAVDNLETAARALDEIERQGVSSDLVDEVFRRLHTLKGGAGTVGMQSVANAIHLCEERMADLRVAGPRAGALVDAFQHAMAVISCMVRTASLPEVSQLLGDRLVSLFDRARRAKARRTKTSPMERRAKERRTAHRRDSERDMLRVPVDGLNELTELARRSDEARSDLERRAAELRELAERLEGGDLARPKGEASARFGAASRRLADDAEALKLAGDAFKEKLRELTSVSLRALYKRVVDPTQELALEMGKHVEIETTGQDIHLDRTVASPLGEVLVHLTRNAVAHGIEPREVRVARGKSPSGTVRLSAREDAEAVYVEVLDDGAGIDPQRVRSALVRMGRLSEKEAADLPDAKVIAHIFEPGMSTRSTADGLAGRGVGLDAVRVTLEAVGGKLWVESTLGKETAFVIRLPRGTE